MFNGRSGNLTKEQMANVKEKMAQHNNYGANQLIKKYTNATDEEIEEAKISKK